LCRSGDTPAWSSIQELQLRTSKRFVFYSNADIPAEIRDFYVSANGMPPYVYDDHQVSFWSIEQNVQPT
jgi:hypothetical protein